MAVLEFTAARVIGGHWPALAEASQLLLGFQVTIAGIGIEVQKD
jgi:hypothetical protein